MSFSLLRDSPVLDSQPKYTAVETKMLEVLADGQRHTRVELEACLYDEFGIDKAKSVGVQLVRLRKKLRPRGHDVVCVFAYRKWLYQHIILLGSVQE